MLVYLRQYNHKLCRKRLLERGKNVGNWFGDFKDLENQYLNKLMSLPNANADELISDLKKQKADMVTMEINKLKCQITNLTKTIKNRKFSQQQKMEEISYVNWSIFIHESSKKFKIHFSDEFNDLFDHLYKMDGKYEETLRKIASENLITYTEVVAHAKNKISEEELQRENCSQNNDSGFDCLSGEWTSSKSKPSGSSERNAEGINEEIKMKRKANSSETVNTNCNGSIRLQFEIDISVKNLHEQSIEPNFKLIRK